MSESLFNLDEQSSLALRIIFSILLVILAGMVSGLTLSVFSIGKKELETLASSDKPSTASRAERLLKLAEHEHWVLVTLLVCNAAAVETLPLMMDPFFAGTNLAVSILVPTVLVLIFGEVLPQSIFVRYAFPISAALTPFLWAIMGITFPISWPLAKLLDVIVGHRSVRFIRRAELRHMVVLNLKDRGLIAHSIAKRGDVPSAEQGGEVDEDDITAEEAHLLLGALSLVETGISTIAKPIGNCVGIWKDEPITHDIMMKLVNAGCSRVPVFEKPESSTQFGLKVVGYILAIDLIPLLHESPDEPCWPARFEMHEPIRLQEDVCILEIYEDFVEGKSRIAFLHPPGTELVTSFLTYRDFVEYLAMTKFVDETEKHKHTQNDLRLRDSFASGNSSFTLATASAAIGPHLTRQRSGSAKLTRQPSLHATQHASPPLDGTSPVQGTPLHSTTPMAAAGHTTVYPPASENATAATHQSSSTEPYAFEKVTSEVQTPL